MDPALRQALEELWSNDVPALSDHGSVAVRTIEERHRVRLPDDFADYLRWGSPQKEWVDEGGISWWAVDRIASWHELHDNLPDGIRLPEIEDHASEYLVFADFLDWCCAWAICCAEGSNRGKVALIGVTPDRFVAGSFLSFTRLAANDSDRLHSPAGDHYLDVI